MDKSRYPGSCLLGAGYCLDPAKTSTCSRKKRPSRSIEKAGSLYLDVFQIKLEKGLSIFNRSGVPSPTLKTFEKDYQINYHALENILQDATILKHDEYMVLMEFVRDCKTAGKMQEGVGVKDFLNRIRNENLRKVSVS